MSEPKGFLLVHSTPDGEIGSHPYPYQFFVNAALAAKNILEEAGVPGGITVAETLESAPLGTVIDVPSGYRFRILEADFTSDGALIVPGLVAQINRDWWGTVWPEQFMTTAHHYPGSQFFDHWYLICKKGESQPYAKYNGARMTAGAMDQ